VMVVVMARPPVVSNWAVGCPHQDAATVAERWRFCRSFFKFPLRHCDCCGGPTTGELCPKCRPTFENLVEV
jgi:hypothetical protein